jgi:hypothetical protein
MTKSQIVVLLLFAAPCFCLNQWFSCYLELKLAKIKVEHLTAEHTDVRKTEHELFTTKMKLFETTQSLLDALLEIQRLRNKIE